jgi:hypothetical protein
LDASTKACDALYTDERNRSVCIARIKKIPLPSDLLITGDTYPELKIINDTYDRTEEILYFDYLKNKEIGLKMDFANHLSAPNLFIMIFLLLGFSASSIGNLVIDAISKKQGAIISSTTPLVGLLLGPVVSCIVGAVLVYIFTPSGESHQYFSRKLLNTPIAVFISSFILSFSPVSTIQNIASFVSHQLKSLVGENKGSSNE